MKEVAEEILDIIGKYVKEVVEYESCVDEIVEYLENFEMEIIEVWKESTTYSYKEGY